MRLLLSFLILAVLGLYSVGQNSIVQADEDNMKLSKKEPIFGAWHIFVDGEAPDSALRFMMTFGPATKEFGLVEIAQQFANKSDSKGTFVKVGDDDEDGHHYQVADEMFLYSDAAPFEIVGIERHDFSVHYDEDSDTWTGEALIEQFDLSSNKTSSITVGLNSKRVQGPSQ